MNRAEIDAIQNIRNHPMYRLWYGMRERCEKPTARNYKWYGGRGIRICERWRSFRNFLEDMGPRPAGMSIDRIDPSGPYSPENCRWATQKEQVRNSRTVRIIEFGGEALTLTEWAHRVGIKPPAMWSRLSKHPLSVALTRWK